MMAEILFLGELSL